MRSLQEVLSFENSNLFRLPAGRQGFRYSDFEFNSKPCLVLAMPD